MPSHITSIRSRSDVPTTAEVTAAPSRFLVPVGRVLFALIFFTSLAGHFSPQTIAYAAQAGVPVSQLLVPLSGVIAGLGALSIVLGYRARLGAALIVLFLVPVTLIMHRFWGLSDPMAARLQMGMFLKNVSMLGAALLIIYWGAGPVSLDARARREGR
jgi:putative oxidoreductase